MTTLVAPNAPHGSASRAMARLQLPLHRAALLLWTGYVLVLSALLLVLRWPLTDSAAAAWRQYEACGDSATCLYEQSDLILYRDLYTYLTLAVLAVPLLVAAWAGASLIGREAEQGTVRLAWTQGVSPVRWFVAKLALPGVAVAVGTTVLVVVHHFAWSAGQGRIGTAKSWDSTATFYAGGPVLVALALTALVLGALVGLVWQRTLAALVTAPVAVLLLWGGVFTALPHLWASKTRTSSLDEYLPGKGLPVDEGFVDSSGAHHSFVPGCGPIYHTAGCRSAYDEQHAVGFFQDYQPAAHIWPLQLTASALLLALSAGLVWAAVRLLRHRTGRPTDGVAVAA